MTQEEKAKRYDKALEKAKAYQGLRSEMEIIFPELKESEGKRMRNTAIYACKYMVDNFENSTKQYEDAIAWLEKQGKHARFIEAIQVGDQVTKNEDGVLVNLSQLKRVAKKDNKYGEQKPAEDRYMEGYMNGMNDALKEQKPAWSEEDEKILNSLISSLARIGASTRTDSTSINYTFSKEIDWLKSLRPQNRWKPSDGQMIALDEANTIMYGGENYYLTSLYNDLKKL